MGGQAEVPVLEVHELPWPRAQEMAHAAELEGAKTLVAVYWLETSSGAAEARTRSAGAIASHPEAPRAALHP